MPRFFLVRSGNVATSVLFLFVLFRLSIQVVSWDPSTQICSRRCYHAVTTEGLRLSGRTVGLPLFTPRFSSKKLLVLLWSLFCPPQAWIQNLLDYVSVCESTFVFQAELFLIPSNAARLHTPALVFVSSSSTFFSSFIPSLILLQLTSLPPGTSFKSVELYCLPPPPQLPPLPRSTF